jgi:hypothetical protein
MAQVMVEDMICRTVICFALAVLSATVIGSACRVHVSGVSVIESDVL